MNPIEIVFPPDAQELRPITELESIWRANPDVEVRFPTSLKDRQIKSYLDVLLAHQDSHISQVILCHLAELPEANGYLGMIYKLGDVGVRSAVALRDDLNPKMIDRVLKDSDQDVRAHAVFNRNVSIDRCKELLSDSANEKIKAAIKRAIELKDSR